MGNPHPHGAESDWSTEMEIEWAMALQLGEQPSTQFIDSTEAYSFPLPGICPDSQFTFMNGTFRPPDLDYPPSFVPAGAGFLDNFEFLFDLPQARHMPSASPGSLPSSTGTGNHSSSAYSPDMVSVIHKTSENVITGRYTRSSSLLTLGNALVVDRLSQYKATIDSGAAAH